jgi:hypothetical protein
MPEETPVTNVVLFASEVFIYTVQISVWLGSEVLPRSDLIFLSYIFLSDHRLTGKENAGKENQ